MAVVAVADVILRNDRVGIAHKCRTSPSGVKGGRIDISQFLGGWFSHSLKRKTSSCRVIFSAFLEAASMSRSISESIASRTQETALEAVIHEDWHGAAEA